MTRLVRQEEEELMAELKVSCVIDGIETLGRRIICFAITIVLD